ncbi:cell envelope biogenesis protein OmpA [uncultured Brachyspira sp.]|uniref:cell envelope biogenesis protein OmpA n=1 Tax=uncultured Brachyspira sp. TaxID=221953 RepID=UPI0025FC70CE|nr:cell envelope biogenesis protein OmpA [uncultured Brachyspira sp.]
MKRILLLMIITLFMSSSLFALIESFYIAPKVVYNFNDSGVNNEKGKRIINNYLGAGFSAGFDFYKYQRSLPLRVELEYTFKDGMTGNYHTANILKQSQHSILAAAYYSIHIFHIKKSELRTITAEEIYRRNPIMSLYLGLLMGTKINANTYDRWFEDGGKVKATVTTIPKPVFAVGGAVGFDICVTSFLNLDIGYRLLYGLDNVLSHEFAIAARFPIPDLRK